MWGPVANAELCRELLAGMRLSTGQGLVRAYRYGKREEEHCIFFSQGKAWTLGPCSSDAEFIYWGRSVDHARQVLICCNGTYLKACGQKIVSSPNPVSRCEIMSADQQLDVFSSDK